MARTNKYVAVNFNDIYEKVTNTVSSSSSSASSARHSYSPFGSPSSYSSSAAAHHHIARPSKSYSLSTASRSHGGMLILTRPSPKPLSKAPVEQEQKQHNLQPQQQEQRPRQSQSPRQQPAPAVVSDKARAEPDSISLRPLGKTGSGPSLFSSNSERERDTVPPPVLPKSDKFVPPHLRPGFVAKEPRLKPELQRPGSSGRSRETGNHRSGNPRSPMSTCGPDGRPKSGGFYDRNPRRAGESDPIDMNQPRSDWSRPSSSG